MTATRKFIPALALALAISASLPASAGIHYKATTTTQAAQNQNSNIQVEGWVAGEKARVEFKESANPVMKKGAYLITKDGGKTLFLIDPEEKTYAEWDLQAMMGMVGSIMQGMGPLLKVGSETGMKVEEFMLP